MKAVDAAAEDIAFNAELWTAYKQLGETALAILNDNKYSEEAKDFLRSYYELVYQKRVSELELTNVQLQKAIEDLQLNIDMTSNGQWTDITTVPERQNDKTTNQQIYTMDGRPVTSGSGQHGLFIIRGTDGRFRKVLY
jgi:hypothetical protein